LPPKQGSRQVGRQHALNVRDDRERLPLAIVSLRPVEFGGDMGTRVVVSELVELIGEVRQ
jgi:hypothetical protein